MDIEYPPPGYYISDRNYVIRVVRNRADTRSYAERMILTADDDGCVIIGWQYEPGLGRDLLLSDLSIPEVSRRV